MKPAFFNFNTTTVDRDTSGAASTADAAVREPLDETQLTAEIARIMDRRRSGKPVPASAATEPPRWLGDEADLALVVQGAHDRGAKIAARQPASRHPDTAETATATRPEISAETDSGVATPSTLAWVRTAKRQRLHARLMGAAGWGVSIVVSVVIVLAAGLAIIGWPVASSPSTAQLTSTEVVATPPSR